MAGERWVVLYVIILGYCLFSLLLFAVPRKELDSRHRLVVATIHQVTCYHFRYYQGIQCFKNERGGDEMLKVFYKK